MVDGGLALSSAVGGLRAAVGASCAQNASGQLSLGSCAILELSVVRRSCRNGSGGGVGDTIRPHFSFSRTAVLGQHLASLSFAALYLGAFPSALTFCFSYGFQTSPNPPRGQHQRQALSVDDQPVPIHVLAPIAAQEQNNAKCAKGLALFAACFRSLLTTGDRLLQC